MIPDKVADILLVEDDPQDAELVLAALKERNLGNRIAHVIDGDDALEFVHSSRLFGRWDAASAPKLILLDLKLTKVSGLEVLRELKSEERTRSIPIVVFAALSCESDLADSYRLGANSFVLKPTDPELFGKLVGDIAHYWLTVNQSADH
jgi:two-component system response regulator